MGQRGQGKPYPYRPYHVRLWRAQQAGEDHLEAEVPCQLVLEVEVEGLSWLEVEEAAGRWSEEGQMLRGPIDIVVDPWREIRWRRVL